MTLPPPRWDLESIYPGLDSPELNKALTDLRAQATVLEQLLAGAPGSSAPLASITASMAITVSPAPLTSNTSRVCVGSCSASLVRYRLMPSSLRVISSASSCNSMRSFSALLLNSASVFQLPTTSRNSLRFGVTYVAQR